MADSESSTVARPSAESVGHYGNEELDSSVWSEFPDNLVENLLSLFPELQCLTRFRRVCKSWNTLFSSAYFINLWNEAHYTNNRCQPWLLLLSSPKAAIPALFYSFTTNTWREMGFSFLPKHSKYGHVNFKGSAGGLLLMDMVPSSSIPSSNVSMLCICNPLIESWISLPPMISITRVMASCTTDSGNGNYSVMVVGKTIMNLFVLEVYESSVKVWKIMITASLTDVLSIRNEEIVLCDGFSLCIRLKASGILICSMHSRSWTMVAMPLLCTNGHHGNYNCNLRSTKLLSCESNIFMVGGLEKHADSTLNEIIIWQFEIMDSVRP